MTRSQPYFSFLNLSPGLRIIHEAVFINGGANELQWSLSVRTMGSVNGFNRSLRRRNGMEVGGGLVFIVRGQPVGITINFVANTPVNGRR